MVVGDQKPFIGCLVTLDPDAVPSWAAERGKPGSTAEDLCEDPELLAEIQRAVDDANRAVSKAEAIRKFVVLPQDWTEEGGEMTPSLKLKRSVVMKQHEREVEELYAGAKQ
jgi:long-chain acyl-CoA synthetase